ncbi:MAG: hypothetical protein N4A47_04260 [Clostridia bacterium]|jgi:hypothetical protein|nr:hypothetical protein [Clostridia bacterium]
MRKLIVTMIATLVFVGCKNVEVKENHVDKMQGYEVLATMNQKVEGNSMYCSTMQLAWNEIGERFDKVEVLTKNDLTNNLEKKEFTKDMLSEDDYIATSIIPVRESLEKLKNDVKNKFKEPSDILDMIEPSADGYLFYSILLKNFEYKYAFKDLGEKEGKRYFGFYRHSDDEDVLDQVDVLFYNNKDDFALRINTKDNEELYFYKSDDIQDFSSEYDEMIEKSKTYKGMYHMTENDYMKIPYMKFDEFKAYEKLKGVELRLDEMDYVVTKAIQTIKFELTNKGGKLKSEAAIMVEKCAPVELDDLERDFICDKQFTMFIKEENKERPYFALRMEK